MNDVPMLITGATHQMYGVLLATLVRDRSDSSVDHEVAPDSYRGAVSLEQVLWFAAAGISVAVIATILWNQIRDQANTPIDDPEPPTP